MAIRNFTICKNKLDDLNHHYQFLLHRKGLIHLLDDLYDVRPVIYKLLGIFIQRSQVLACIDLVSVTELIKKLQVIVSCLPVQMKAKKFLDVSTFIIRYPITCNNGKKLNYCFE